MGLWSSHRAPGASRVCRSGTHQLPVLDPRETLGVSALTLPHEGFPVNSTAESHPPFPYPYSTCLGNTVGLSETGGGATPPLSSSHRCPGRHRSCPRPQSTTSSQVEEVTGRRMDQESRREGTPVPCHGTLEHPVSGRHTSRTVLVSLPPKRVFVGGHTTSGSVVARSGSFSEPRETVSGVGVVVHV